MSALIPTLPTRKPASAATAVLATAAVIALLYFGRILLITLVISTIIAFLLDPLVSFFVRFRFPRPLASLVVCCIALVGLYFVGLGTYTEIAGLMEELPNYSGRINAIADAVATRMDQIEKNTVQVLVPKRFRTDSDAAGAPPTPSQNTQPITNIVKGRRRGGGPPPGPVQPIPEVRIHQDPKPLFSYLYGYLASFYDFVLMASFVPFLVYFMLSWRDHMRRTFLYLFQGADRQAAHKTWESIADAARAYVLGNFLLGLILSIVGACFFLTIKMPYWLLVGVSAVS